MPHLSSLRCHGCERVRVYHLFEDTTGDDFMVYQAMSRIPGVKAFWFKPKGDMALIGKADLTVTHEMVEKLAPAAEPLIWTPITGTPAYDVGYVGSPDAHEEDWLEAMFSAFPSFEFNQYAQFEDKAALMAGCRVALNNHLGAMCQGNTVLMHESDADNMGLTDGLQCLTYRDAEGAVEKIKAFLPHPDRRAAIGARARAWVRNGHTYFHRALSLLSRARHTPDLSFDLEKVLATPPFEGEAWGQNRDERLKHIAV